MREIIITKAQEGQRLDRLLGKYLPGASSGFLHKMLRKKNIKLNDQRADGSEKVLSGDSVKIYFSEETLEKFMGKARPEPVKEQSSRSKDRRNKPVGEGMSQRKRVKTLYEDENVIILHKPVGMLTQRAEITDDSLNDYLIDYCLEKGILQEETLQTFRPAAANRLDRNTSGMVLCGITTKGLQDISALLRNRNLGKYYLCIVEGNVKNGKNLKGYLVKDEKTNVVRYTKEEEAGAMPIETSYRVVKSNEKASLLKVKLITGKSHQIRAHLASDGHPVLGDFKYGNREWNMQAKREIGISWQMLHSYQLAFPESLQDTLSPLAGKLLTDPVPKEFARALQWLGLK